jgi:hypothetical protein
MRCTVVYLPEAEAELASAWMAAPDQQAAADASNRMDRLLKFRAEDVGEPYGEQHRRLVVEPLAVVYRVVPADRRVEVVHVELLVP